jgi:hypothetical protein
MSPSLGSEPAARAPGGFDVVVGGGWWGCVQERLGKVVGRAPDPEQVLTLQPLFHEIERALYLICFQKTALAVLFLGVSNPLNDGIELDVASPKKERGEVEFVFCVGD